MVKAAPAEAQAAWRAAYKGRKVAACAVALRGIQFCSEPIGRSIMAKKRKKATKSKKAKKAAPAKKKTVKKTKKAKAKSAKKAAPAKKTAPVKKAKKKVKKAAPKPAEPPAPAGSGSIMPTFSSLFGGGKTEN
jgi:outer membrane biosynthesis protein TonB